MIEQGTQTGVFKLAEQEMIAGVFHLSNCNVSAIMTPRSDVIWLDPNDPPEDTRRKITASQHACFPVAQDELDNVLGLVQVRDLLAQSFACQPTDLKTALCPALFVPENVSATRLLERFKETLSPIALVIDEYGEVQGLVTVYDVLEAIAGDIPLIEENTEPDVIRRSDGSWLVNGRLLADELKDLLRTKQLPDERQGQLPNIGWICHGILGAHSIGRRSL